MKYRYKDIAMIAGSLGRLYNDGIYIQKSMELLVELPLNLKYRESIIRIKSLIDKGNTLSDSFANYESIYPRFFLGFLKLGEESGELYNVLLSLEKFYQSKYKIKIKIINALCYPAFLVLAIFVLIAITFFLIIPMFYQTFSEISKNIPTTIKFLYNIRSNFIERPITYFVYIVCWIIVPSILIFLVLLEKEVHKKVICNMKLGKQYNEYILVLVFSVILNSGATINSGIDICIKAGDIGIEEGELKRISDALMDGIGLSEVLIENKHLSKYSKAIIVLGENSGSLDSSFKKLEENFRKSLDKSIEKTLKLIQPTMILSIGFLVVLFILIFVEPIFEMMNFKAGM